MKLEKHYARVIHTFGVSASQPLLLWIAFACAMLAFRIYYSGETSFSFLAWNVLLAAIPLWIARRMERNDTRLGSGFIFLLCCGTFLAFLPNSFYIVTDLFHLRQRPGMPYWFDLSLLFSFAWCGIMLGVESLHRVLALVRCRWPGLSQILLETIVFFFAAVGIYIGRYLRYNSWDLLTRPGDLCYVMLDMLLHPFQNRFEWSMIVCFTVLLLLVYRSMGTPFRRNAVLERPRR